MTLIKWPGGKSSEIKEFEDLIPDYERYIEPFFGGGAVFFHQKPKKSIINDVSKNLMDFYSLVKAQDVTFKNWLLAYDASFQTVYKNAVTAAPFLLRKFDQHEVVLLEEIISIVRGEYFEQAPEDPDYGHLIQPKKQHLILQEKDYLDRLYPDFDDYYQTLYQSVNDKIRRTINNHGKKPMTREDIVKNLVTGFTAGFYTYFRKIYNDLQLNRTADQYPLAYKIANFYWIREYCYGSMFRYNKDGEFNIPYGGISYNNKNFTHKINKIFSDQIEKLFEDTEIFKFDFEKLLLKIDVNDKDFIFLDPPYDTEFSAYEGKDFGKNDQVRLRDYLLETPANFILVIKNTEFIFELYNRKEFKFANFETNYIYNVRARNNQKATHLIIMNADIPRKNR